VGWRVLGLIGATASKIAIRLSSLIHGLRSGGTFRASSRNRAAMNRAIWFLFRMPNGKKVLFSLVCAILAYRQAPLTTVLLETINQLPHSSAPAAAFCRSVFKHHYSGMVARDQFCRGCN